jgi:hypothetical protein
MSTRHAEQCPIPNSRFRLTHDVAFRSVQPGWGCSTTAKSEILWKKGGCDAHASIPFCSTVVQLGCPKTKTAGYVLCRYKIGRLDSTPCKKSFRLGHTYKTQRPITVTLGPDYCHSCDFAAKSNTHRAMHPGFVTI